MTSENKRAEIARAHDDHELIDQIEPARAMADPPAGI